MTAPATYEPQDVGPPPPPARRDPRVLTWLVAVAVSWFGDAVWTVALAWTAAHTLPPAVAGAVLAAELVPQAALVLVGGVLADRGDPRRVLVLGQVARAAVLLLAAAAWVGGLQGAPVLTGVAVSFGVASGLTLPAGNTLVRQLVAGQDLTTVMGWNQISNRATRLLGAPAGGVLVAWGGPVAAMLVDAATFLVVAVVLLLVVRARYRLPRAESPRWRDSLTGGLHHLRRDRTAALLVGGLTALNVFVTPVTGLGVALRVDGSGWGPAWLGVADGALAAGAIAGSVVALRHRPEHGAAAGFRLLVVQGAAIACVGVPWRPVLLLAMAVLGITAGAASVWLGAAFVRTVAPAYLGRVSSVNSLGDMTLTPLSVPALGLVAGHAGVLTATVACGLSMAALCLWFATRERLRLLVA